mgnify:FL=1
MVRLLQGVDEVLFFECLCFNSSMVRLLPIPKGTALTFDVFQFLNGTIITSILASNAQPGFSFNSSMVRLLQQHLEERIASEALVSIPQWYDYYQHWGYTTASQKCFNSSMVRLLLLADDLT